MRRSVIPHLLGRKPFRAFRLTLSNDESFEIKHPEAAYLAKKLVAIAAATTQAEEMREGEMVWIDYRHIVHCQPLPKREILF